MNYRDAYHHLIHQLVPIIEGMEQSPPMRTQAEISLQLRRLQVECEEIRIGQNPYPVHRAPRRGSTMNTE